MISDFSIVALLIPALDGPNPPIREYWAKTFKRTAEEMDAIFEIAHHERERPLIEISSLKAREELSDE
jgi:hypothetical protein